MKFLKKSFYYGGILALLGGGIGVMTMTATILYLAPLLPQVESLQDIKLQTPLRIYSSDGQLISEFGEKRRVPVEFDQIPQNLINALLAAEDQRFYQHSGVDIKGLARAAKELVTTGSIKSGGSTITMQVARNFFLTRKQTFIRKFNEILLALQIESMLEKNDILSLYVNKIYLGHRAYGIGAAAQVYYGLPLSELSLPQLAMIAGLPKAPSRYNPITNPDRSKKRRDWILQRMHFLEFIDTTTYEAAIQAPVTASFHGLRQELYAPYLAEMVRQDLLDRYGSKIYEDGFNVTTTVNSQLQQHAQASVMRGLATYDRRHGYRGPEGRVDPQKLKQLQQQEPQTYITKLLKPYYSIGEHHPAIVLTANELEAIVALKNGTQALVPLEHLQWARKHLTANSMGKAVSSVTEVLEPGHIIRILLTEEAVKETKPEDVTSPITDSERTAGLPIAKLSQIPIAQSALVSLAPQDGKVLAIVGGFDFRISKFNRATQATRQAGSSIKPFIYGAALEAGYSAASLINDAPLIFQDKHLESAWRPENSSGKFNGPTRLREALYQSRNLVSIRLLRELGVREAINTLIRYGFDPKILPSNLSLALGTAAMTPFEVAQRYATLANGGYKVSAYYIDTIRDANNTIIYQHKPTKVCTECLLDNTEEAKPVSPLEASMAFFETEELNQPQVPNSAEQAQMDYSPAPRVMNEQLWYIVRSMMSDVIKKGTGRRARAMGRNDLAGKTGTTNDQKDAWFSGFNNDVVTTVWVGFDDPATLGRREYGGSVALPIWIDYMGTALKDSPDQLPPAPAGLVSVRIDPKTGKRAQPGQKGAIFEFFRQENTPALANNEDQINFDNGAGSTEEDSSTVLEVIF